jgi:4-phytase/acid phosphatase
VAGFAAPIDRLAAVEKRAGLKHTPCEGRPDMPTRKLPAMALSVLAVCLAATAAQAPPTLPEQLQFVVILTRHGVRSPTWPTERLNQFSTQGWPSWGVPPGHLTPRGKELTELLGAYDRAYLAEEGLLSAKGCEDATRLFLWADTDQRTIETGRALASGMFPGCSVHVRSLPEGTTDPLFSPMAASVGRPDRALAVAAVQGRIGSNPGALLEAYRPTLETMQQVLFGCTPGPNCPPEGAAVEQFLLDLPASVGPGKGEKLVDFAGPLSTAATLAQNFLLEYANGMAGNDLGWGRVNESNLRQMMALHIAYADLARRTLYLARTNGSNLLSHMLKSMDQAISRKRVRGALGTPHDKGVVIVGHDTNIANVAAMLRLSWLIKGYQRDDTPPGGALVFEVWYHPISKAYSVRTYYTAQTLEQMRKALPLTLDSPPAKAPVFVPGCSTADEAFSCNWNQFRRTVETAIDPTFVKP